MPVWGVWHDGAFWFSSSGRSRKARNLAADPRCVVTTDNPVDPVVVEGTAEVDGHLVGALLIAAWDGWRGNLYRLAVLSGWRRRGIARQLIAEGERRLASKGVVHVSALALTEHEPAVGLWWVVGCQRDGRVGRFVKSLV